MKPYDATRNIRQMFHKPNILPFANVLLIVLFALYLVPSAIGFSGYGFEIPDATNFDIEPLDGLPLIKIYINGAIVLDERLIEDLEKLPVLIEDEMEKYQPEENKILIKIDRDVPFGKIQEVLTFVKKANVETIGFITRENVTLEQLWATSTK
jgi:biopolymer transport protein ExbD